MVLQCLWLGSLFFPIDISDEENETESKQERNTLTSRKETTENDNAVNFVANCDNSSPARQPVKDNDVRMTELKQQIDEPLRNNQVQPDDDPEAATDVTGCCCSTWQPLKRMHKLWNCALLKNKAFVLYIFVLFMTELAIGLFYKFSGIRAQNAGLSRQQASLIPSAIALASTCTRIVVSIVANLSCVSTRVS